MAISIYGPIYAETALEAAEEIRLAAGDLDIRINSPGGELEGLATIVAALHDWRAANPAAKCTATVEALAASAAAYLLLMLPRGSEVRAYPMAMLMFHSSATCAFGGSSAMRDAAHYLSRMDAVLRAYLERTAIPRETIDECLQEGRQLWLNAEDAEYYGIVDNIIDGEAELPALAADSEYRAVALFYPPTNPNQENTIMAKSLKAKAAKAAEEEIEKTEVVETTDGEKQIVETETEVKPAEEPAPAAPEEQPAEAECEPKAEEPDTLAETVAALTARIEELEQKLVAAEAAQAHAEASLAALTGGLRGNGQVKPEEVKPTDWKAAYAQYRAAHPEMPADDAFVACARLYPELHRATIRTATPVFNR